MINPNSQRKGGGRRSEKKEKEEMERRKKKKDENKEKNKKEEERFPVKFRREVKREKKQFSINERKRAKFFKPDCHSKSFFDWQYPTPREQRGKDRNTQLPLQKHHPRENPIGP